MPAWIATIAFVLARLSGLLFVVPGMSRRVIPWRIRAVLVSLLAVPVLSLLPFDTRVLPWDLPHLAMSMFHEFLVGLTLGLAPAVMVWGLLMAAQSVGGMTGLPGGSDSLEGPAPSGGLHQLLGVFACTLFFASGGHGQVIQAVLLSFDWLAPGEQLALDGGLLLLVEVVSQSFGLGVRALAPIGLPLAVSLMTLMVVNRVLPQLGYFAVGMSIQNLILLGALTVFIGSLGWFLEAEFQASPLRVRELWQQLLPQ